MKLKTEIKKTFKINNLKDDTQILWKKMTCTCKKGIVMEEHPVKPCLHCKYTIQQNSMPRKSFIIKDAKGKDKVINEISIKRGSHDEVVAWEF